MPRPVWKGKYLLNSIYSVSVYNYELSELVNDADANLPLPEDSDLKLYRRNTYMHPFVVQHLESGQGALELYTGYDFLVKFLDSKLVGHNLGTLINTREIKVVHKIKQTKQQRKNAANQRAKKKLINVSKKPKTKMKNKPIKRVAKK